MIRRLPVILPSIERLAIVLVPLATVLLALAVAVTGSELAALAGLGLLAAAIAALMFLRWPGLGPVLLIPVSFFVPFSIGTGTRSEINAPMVMVAGLVALWLVSLVLDSGRPPLRLARSEIALIVLAVIFVIALATGQGSWLPLARRAPLSAQVGAVGLVFLSIGAFFIAAEQVRDVRWLKAMVALFLLLGGMFVVSVLFDPLVPYMIRIYEPSSISSQFWTWFAALAFGQAVFNRTMHPALRLALAGLTAVSIYSVYVSVPGWQSGWMPAAVAVALIALLHSIWAGLAVAGGLLILAPRIFRAVATTESYSYSTRVLAWEIVTHIIKANPILGLGPANYYWYTPLFAIAGYYGLQFNSHNQYVDLLAQTGVLGLLAFLWFVAEMAWLGWSLRNRVPDGFARGYLYGVLGGLGASLFAGMLGDWVLPFVYNVSFVGFRSSMFFWLFLGGLLALSRMSLSESKRAGREPQSLVFPPR